MNFSEIRRLARENLQGRWGKVAILTLVFMLLSGVMVGISAFIPFIGGLVYVVIGPVLSFGFLNEMIKFYHKENVECTDFLKLGFDNFTKVWSVIFRIILKLIGPIILGFVSMIGIIIATVVISCGIMGEANGVEMALDPTMGAIGLIIIGVSIIVSIGASIWSIPITYKYMFALYELTYDKESDTKEIVEKSGNMMIGNRFNAFVLTLTFIGWLMLSLLGCYIPLLWITPYLQIALVIFYERVSKRGGQIENSISTM